VDGGRNKSAISDTVPPRTAKPQEIRLRLEDLNGHLIAISTLSLPLYTPKVLLFESNDKYISRVSQTEFSVKAGANTNIIAQPFFFNTYGIDSLIFNWAHNGVPISDTGTDPRILNIKVPSDIPIGERESFSVNVSNPLNTFETARQSFTINIIQ